jgi:DNA replication protein DnaC
MPASNPTPRPRSSCPDCSGDGWVRSERGCVPCPKCATKNRIAAQLPERYRWARLDDFTDGLRAAVLAWLDHPGDGMLLLGECGTGKTHLAAAVIVEAIRRGGPLWDATFRRCADLYAALREAYRSGTSEESVLRDYANPRLLVLDDLGAGNLSDHERRFTLEILDRRHNAKLPTVVTTNWDLARISEQLDDRIASRLSGFLRIVPGGSDRRLRA